MDNSAFIILLAMTGRLVYPSCSALSEWRFKVPDRPDDCEGEHRRSGPVHHRRKEELTERWETGSRCNPQTEEQPSSNSEGRGGSGSGGGQRSAFNNERRANSERRGVTRPGPAGAGSGSLSGRRNLTGSVSLRSLEERKLGGRISQSADIRHSFTHTRLRRFPFSKNKKKSSQI